MFKAYSKPDLVYKFEKSPELEIELRFPTSETEVQFEKFLAQDPILLEAEVYQIALVAVRTNLKDEKDNPLFEEKSSFGEKILKIYSMPSEMIFEIHKALCEFYPDWKLTE